MPIQDQIRQFIVDTGRWHGAITELSLDYALIDNEVLDSLGIFELVSFVEDEFGVTIDDEDLVIENFGSIGAIESMVAAKVGTR
jgi:acyl carrier protein